MMQKFACLLTIFSLTTGLNIVFSVNSTSILAQAEETETPPLEEQTEPTEEQEQETTEQQLEQDLNIEEKYPEQPTVEELPAPPTGLDPNVPEAPDEEIEIKN